LKAFQTLLKRHNPTDLIDVDGRYPLCQER
jgi:hypothetical protein